MRSQYLNFHPSQGVFNLIFGLLLVIAGTLLVLTPAKAQDTMTSPPISCIGNCTPLPQFSVGTFGQGWTGAANYSSFGPGGVGSADSLSQDFMKIEVNVKAAGNPNGLCGDGCIGNVAEVTMSAGVLAQGMAVHKFELAPASTTGWTQANTNSASSVGFGAIAGAVWGLQVQNPPLPMPAATAP